MTKITLKRGIPPLEVLLWRQRFLAGLQSLTPSPPLQNAPTGLRPGNTKVGVSGLHYKSGFVWNLPSVATCPGASKWCRCHCYNADPRADVFPVDEWLENWAWFLHRPDQLRTVITNQLRGAAKPAAVRVHSSGDFYSIPYINFWFDLVKNHPSVRFWAYTRSWVIEDLRTALEPLRELPNFQLFASVDNTMAHAPHSWRLAIVVGEASEARRGVDSLPCPEQFGKLSNCLSCGYCMARNHGNVIFTLH